VETSTVKEDQNLATVREFQENVHLNTAYHLSVHRFWTVDDAPALFVY
jgi:hypothetical protein